MGIQESIALVGQLGAVLELSAAAQMTVAPTRLLPASKEQLRAALRECFLAHYRAGALTASLQQTLETGYVSLAQFLEDEQEVAGINAMLLSGDNGDHQERAHALRRYRATIKEGEELLAEFRRFIADATRERSTTRNERAKAVSAQRPPVGAWPQRLGSLIMVLSAALALVGLAVFVEHLQLGQTELVARDVWQLTAISVEAGFGYAVLSGHRFASGYVYAVISCFMLGILTPAGFVFMLLNILSVALRRSQTTPVVAG